MTTTLSLLLRLSAQSALLVLMACGSETGSKGPSDTSSHPLVIVTERESTDVSLQYLHVLADWPSDGVLDYSRAVELGDALDVHAQDGAVFVYTYEDHSLQKYTADEQLNIQPKERISFDAYGVEGWDAEIIWYSAQRAFLVDEISGQILRFNPETMAIEGSAEIDRGLLERYPLPVQFQQGITAGERAFTAVSYRDWETEEFEQGVRLGFFDASSDTPSFQLIEGDDRCAPSISLRPFADEQGNVYVFGDAGLGYFRMASPNKTSLPQCVRRVKAGENQFDPDFFVDINQLTNSPGFREAHPMADMKLLINTWSPEVSIDDVADPMDPSWFWGYVPHFQYYVVDMKRGTSKPVEGLPVAAVQFSKTLRVDDLNYVQLYRDDLGSTLYRVDTNATVTQVLENESGTDVQYLGRM